MQVRMHHAFARAYEKFLAIELHFLKTTFLCTANQLCQADVSNATRLEILTLLKRGNGERNKGVYELLKKLVKH